MHAFLVKVFVDLVDSQLRSLGLSGCGVGLLSDQLGVAGLIKQASVLDIASIVSL